MTPKEIIEQLVVEKFQALAALKQAQERVAALEAKVRALTTPITSDKPEPSQ